MENVSRTATVEIVFSEPLLGVVLPTGQPTSLYFELRGPGGFAGIWSSASDGEGGDTGVHSALGDGAVRQVSPEARLGRPGAIFRPPSSDGAQRSHEYFRRFRRAADLLSKDQDCLQASCGAKLDRAGPTRLS